MTFTYFVIGAGSIGRRHFGNLKTLGCKARLVPWRAYDPAEFQAVLKQHQGQVAVVIATATGIRLDLVSLCASLSVPVYIEKPAGYTPEQVRQIFAVPDRLKRSCVVGFMMRYHPLVAHVLDHLPEKIFRSHVQVGHDVSQWRQDWAFSKSYAAKPDGGGVLLDLCHELDLACVLDPDIKLQSVQCLGHQDYPGVDMAASVTGFGKRLGLCTIELDYLAPRLVRQGTLEGLSGKLEYTLTDNVVRSSTGQDEEKVTLECDRNQLFLGLMQDFVTLAEQRDGPVHPLCPRMDRVETSCRLIAEAWSKRTFVGQIEADVR